jgi:hypothetical protein
MGGDSMADQRERRFLLWDNDRGAWWCPAGQGFTDDSDDAGRFPQGFAELQVKQGGATTHGQMKTAMLLEPTGRTPRSQLGRLELVDVLAALDKQIATGQFEPDVLIMRGSVAHRLGVDMLPDGGRRG